MKRIFLILISVPTLGFSQTKYQQGYKNGYSAGCKYVNPYGNCSVLSAPYPSLSQNKDSYQNGYQNGYQDGMKQSSSNGSYERKPRQYGDYIEPYDTKSLTETLKYLESTRGSVNQAEFNRIQYQLKDLSTRVYVLTTVLTASKSPKIKAIYNDKIYPKIRQYHKLLEYSGNVRYDNTEVISYLIQNLTNLYTFFDDTLSLLNIEEIDQAFRDSK